MAKLKPLKPDAKKDFSIVLPKFDNSGKRIKTEISKDVAEKMSNRFRGVSVSPTILGCYISKKSKKLECEENVKLVSSSGCDSDAKICKRQYNKDLTFMKNLAYNTGKKLGQESILISEANVDTFFIEAKKRQRIHKRYSEKDIFKKIIV